MYGFDALPIPTVSETWLYKPSNFVSRQAVISGSLGLYILHLAVYLATRHVNPMLSAVLFVIAVASAFCLGVIGGVCMGDKTPDCLSSIKVHDDFAVMYFVLVDIWMFGMHLLFPRNKWRFMCLAISLACAVELPQHLMSEMDLPPITGLVEWVNTLMVFGFCISFCHQHLANVRFGVLDDTKRNGKELDVVLMQVSNFVLTACVITMYLFALGMGFAVYVQQGNIHMGFPSVSDLYVLPPGNSIGRLWGVFASTCCYAVMIQFYHVYHKQFARRLQAMQICTLSLSAIFFLSLASCINKVEDSMLHYIVVVIFFLLFQTFQLLVGKSKVAQRLTTACLLAKSRIYMPNMHLFAIMEFVDLICMLLFVSFYAYEHIVELNEFPFALYTVVVKEENPASSPLLAKHEEKV